MEDTAMTKTTNIKETLASLAAAPNTQIDEAIKKRLGAMSEQKMPDAYELKRILDECAYLSLASDFAMKAMHFLHEDTMKEIYR